MSVVGRLLPARRWLRTYRRRVMAGDLGGLAVSSMLIPQGLAVARIHRVPPVAGLWSGIAGMTAYALFGPEFLSRPILVGDINGIALCRSSRSSRCERRLSQGGGLS